MSRKSYQPIPTFVNINNLVTAPIISCLLTARGKLVQLHLDTQLNGKVFESTPKTAFCCCLQCILVRSIAQQSSFTVCSLSPFKNCLVWFSKAPFLNPGRTRKTEVIYHICSRPRHWQTIELQRAEIQIYPAKCFRIAPYKRLYSLQKTLTLKYSNSFCMLIF